MNKKLNAGAVLNELKGQSAFFNPPKSPTKAGMKPPEKQPQTHRVTDSQTDRVPESGTARLTDFEGYHVPDYRKLQRLELRLTWEQKEYLDRLEGIIARDMPEGERADPDYKRITKNSIVRVLVEILRYLNLSIDASCFKSERDLAKDVFAKLTDRLTELQTDKSLESQTDRVGESQTSFDRGEGTPSE
ncbi:MAG: hypothetical protein PVF83_11520 [Anaerolineales bacterium]|jgi:hypothetical protein